MSHQYIAFINEKIFTRCEKIDDIIIINKKYFGGISDIFLHGNYSFFMVKIDSEYLSEFIIEYLKYNTVDKIYIVEIPLTNTEFKKTDLHYKDLIKNEKKITMIIHKTNMISVKESYSLNDIETYKKFNISYPSLAKCLENNLENIFNYLINNKNIVDSKYFSQKNLMSALEWCINSNDTDKFEIIINNNVDVNYNNGKLLLCAGTSNNIFFISTLLKKGLQFHYITETLKIIILNNNINVLIEILKFYHCSEALPLSIELDNLEIFKFLFHKEKKIMDNMEQYAVSMGALNIVKYLVANGFNFNTIILDGKKDKNIFKFFVENGIQINNNLVELFKKYCITNKLDIELLECFKILNIDIHMEKELPFRSSCQNGNLEVCKFYLEKGVDVNIQDGFALRWSVHFHHTEIVKLLLEYGADIHVKNDTVLKTVKNKNYQDLMELLGIKNE